MSHQGSVKGYFALVLVLEALMIGVFAATDVFLFYVFFEAMLIPVYFMIGRYGGPQALLRRREVPDLQLGRRPVHVGLADRAVRSFRAESRARALLTSPHWLVWILTLTFRRLLFLGFFFAFAIKAPLWPFHTWLPDAAGQSTARNLGAADRCIGQGRNFRHDPVLPGNLPGGKYLSMPRL